MNIVTFGENAKNFTSLTFDFLKIPYHYFKDLDDFENNLSDIKNDRIIVLYRDYGFTQDFIYHLEDIKKLESNTILSSKNIVFEKEKLGKIIPFHKYQNSELYQNKSIMAFLIKKNDISELLKNKEIRTFDQLSKQVRYEQICTFNCATQIRFINNMIDVSDKLFCNNFRNKKNIEDIKNIKSSYFQFLKNKKMNTNYQNQIVKIYNEINPLSINVCILKYTNPESFSKLIHTYQESIFNNSFHQIIIVDCPDPKEIDTDLIKSKILYLEGNLNNLILELKKIPINYDIYFLDCPKKINQHVKNKKIQIIYHSEQNKFEIFKISNYLFQFLLFPYKDWNNLISELGNIALYYFKYELHIINDPILENYELQKTKIIPNLTLIDSLYEEKNYDESCYLINFIIKNRFSYNYTFIYKTLVLIDKVNYVIHANEIKSLLTLLDTKNFDDIFNVCVVLIHNKNHSLAFELFDKYISENQILESEILKVILFCVWFNLFDKEINISKDVFLINHILSHLDFLIENLNKILDIEKDIKVKELRVKILMYLNNRYDLIDDLEKKEIINQEILKISLDFNNLDNYTDPEIISKFLEFPKLVINSCYILSDFMMSESDILVKRKNLLRLTSIILKNFDKFEDKFVKMIKDGVDISLTNLFRYAYQGIPNKELFYNCISITRKYKKLHFDKVINPDNKMKTEKDNLFIYDYKKTNPKKICFISEFLTRKHSVFKDRHQVIINLVKKNFEVYLASFKPLDFKHAQIYYGIKENIVLGNMNTFNIVQKMRSYEFDKLVFCEIGMDNRVTEIAHFRMANKQYNTWGHSDTSGYSEIDYFVSSELYELPYEESKNHYTEKLILQKGMCTSYVNPTSCYKLNLPRSFYGLSNYEKIICCPQSLFKIHPIFDEYIFEILKRNKDVSLVFLDNHEKKFKMYERWNQVLKNKQEYYGILSRVKFLPGQDHQKFCNLMKVSDLLIDPYPFGGCNSSLESFSLGKPLVTQPSQRINGRFTYGFYKKMEIYDLIAQNQEEYVSLVTKLLQDNKFYQEVSQKIKDKNSILFQEQLTLDEWEEIMAESN